MSYAGWGKDRWRLAVVGGSAGAIKTGPNTEGAPDLARPTGYSAPLSASPSNPPRLPRAAHPSCEVDKDRMNPP